MLENYINIFTNNKEVYLRVKVLPSAGKTEAVKELSDGTIKITVAAPPVRGRANSELIKFLADEFEVSKRNITIISGAGERLKLIKVIQ